MNRHAARCVYLGTRRPIVGIEREIDRAFGRPLHQLS
jgi:hypothetical protein